MMTYDYIVIGAGSVVAVKQPYAWRTTRNTGDRLMAQNRGL